MTIAARVKKFFDNHRVPYRVYSHQRTSTLGQAAELVGISKSQVVKTVVLEDGLGAILAVLPLERRIDFIQLKKQLQRNLRVLPEFKVNRIFLDCEGGSHPPFGRPYGLDVVIDKTIEKLDYIFFEAGSHSSLVQISLEDFFYLNTEAVRMSFVGRAKAVKSTAVYAYDEHQDEPEALLPSCSFPNLPSIARRLLSIATHASKSTEELADIVARDPSIIQQIMSYARLPFQSGAKAVEVATIKEAINHVLGFETVSHIALGISAGKVIQPSTQLDLRAFWRHAFFAAALSQRIAKMVSHTDVDPCMCYLSGLMHNFGLLLFAKLYPPEFRLLNKWMRLNPKISIHVLEKRLLGMGHAMHVVRGGHAQLGAWLLKHWKMPEPTIIVAREHHSLQYTGQHQAYVNIIKLTNQSLRCHNIGEGEFGGPNTELLTALQLQEEQVDEALSAIMAGASGLENIASTFAS